jgi:hypothetical protein
MRFLIGTVVIFLSASVSPAATIQVPGDYGTIQEAIDAAANGDTVLVHPGTYGENIIIPVKDIVLTGELGPSITIIDGNKAGSVVDFLSGIGNSTVIKGFTITNGYNDYGGGIVCRNNACPTIMDNKIILNTFSTSGGGIYCYPGASPLIKNNLIAENTDGVTGGGIHCENTPSLGISNNTIRENKAVYGAGLYLAYNSFLLENNTIAKNISYGYGGAIYIKGSDAQFVNDIFLLNQAYSSEGGGISCNNCTDLDFINCTFFRNQGILAGAIRSVHCQIDIVNTILWDDQGLTAKEIYLGSASQPSVLDISHSDVDGGQASIYVESGSTLNWGPGMIDADPLLANPISHGDAHLKYTSPCRNAGDDSAPGLPSEDFEGDPRIALGTVDMGADEFNTHLYWTGDATPGGYLELMFVGIPGTTPVQFWVGSGIFDPPLKTKYGDWHLLFPLLINIPYFGQIPSPDGIMNAVFYLDPTTPAPLWIPMQSGVGMELTNLSILKIE